ncbi:MAG TPA: helix-turn-helix domain-containing protein [Candidatus Deferrimicrobium sp.]|nr:helix-turn-helix domain-containing protein [Candidatus Deferrimicrobium sp.]
MSKKIHSTGIASRLKTIRTEKGLTVKELSSQLGVGPNDYRKYESAVYTPPVHIQVLLAQKFNISLDWLILNKEPMYRDQIETALGQSEKLGGVEVAADGVIVTSPEIKDLVRFMEANPVYKFQLLSDFYRYKQEGVKAV